MNAFYGLAIATSLINGLLFDWSFWGIYFLVFLAYCAMWYITMPKKDQSKRKTIMISTWNGKKTSILNSKFRVIEPYRLHR